jgi:serine/threonine protein kinase
MGSGYVDDMTVVGSGLLAGRYRVAELLGQGGMGRVWLAHDVVLDRDVAVKEFVLPADLPAGEREAFQRRTLREAQAAARLTHPNVAQVFDVFEVDGQPWIVLEHVPSRTLQQVVDAEGPLEPKRVAGIGLDVLDALRAAHRAGVLHRDVKPSNVLLTEAGRVVLTDFGIATIEGDASVTSSGQVLGSPQFMAPERALRGVSLPASDLWSLGATLYATVEGRPPYSRPSAIGTLMALAAEEPEPPRRAGALGPVLEGLLRKDPEKRIDAEETRRRLRKAAGRRRPVPAPRAAREPAPPAESATAVASAESVAASAPRFVAGSHRRQWIIVLVVAALLVLAGSGVLIATKFRERGSGSVASGPSTGVSPSSAPVTTSAAPTPAASASVKPSATSPSGKASRPALPSGWTDYRDRTGFSVYVPQGWKRSQDGSIVYFRSAGRVLGIDQTTHPNMNPVADWQGKADYRVAHGDFPGYHKIRITAVSYYVKAADWEFTFDGSSARQHVNNRGLVVNAHQAYGIYWQAPDAQWDAAYAQLQLVFKSFRPKS